MPRKTEQLCHEDFEVKYVDPYDIVGILWEASKFNVSIENIKPFTSDFQRSFFERWYKRLQPMSTRLCAIRYNDERYLVAVLNQLRDNYIRIAVLGENNSRTIYYIPQ